MKRKDKKRHRSNRNGKKSNLSRGGAKKPNLPETNRRNALAIIRNWGLFGVVAAGTGWYLIDQVMATIEEHDLSQIGNGTPAVVQIHDPQCNRCLALQRETRKALRTLEDGALKYLVANIRTHKGRKFAARHGVGHITLLLFDSKGKRRNVLPGNSNSDILATIFRSHVRQFGKN